MGNEADAGYQPDALLTGAEVARIFRVSAKTVGRWGRSGLLPLYRTPGGDHRYLLADVTAFIASQKRTSDA